MVENKDKNDKEERSGKGFGFRLFLSRGRHRVEVNASEGAYDSLMVGAGQAPRRIFTQKEETEERNFFLRFRSLIILCLIIVIVLIFYVLLKKPRLRI